MRKIPFLVRRACSCPITTKQIGLILTTLSVCYLLAMGLYFGTTRKNCATLDPHLHGHSHTEHVDLPKTQFQSLQDMLSQHETLLHNRDQKREQVPNREIRICFVINEVDGVTKAGGIGTAYGALLDLVRAEGYHITVLLSSTSDDQEHRAAEAKLKAKGIHLAPRLMHYNIAGCGWHCNQGYSILAWLQAQPSFHIVHMHDYLGFAYYPLLVKRQGLLFQSTMFVVGAHGSMAWAMFANNKWIHRSEDLEVVFLERQSMELADYVISPSAYLLDWMRDEGWNISRNAYVQQNLLPATAVDPKPRPATKEDRTPITELVFFGRLETRKGVPLFIDAVERVREMINATRGENMITVNFDVTLMGRVDYVEGSLATSWLEQRTVSWGYTLPTVISSAGRDDAMRYLTKDGRLVVIPSTVENSPFTVLECLEMATPFIASNLTGIRELVHPEDMDKVLFETSVESLSALLFDIFRHGAGTARPRTSNARSRDMWSAFHRHLARDATEVVAASQAPYDPNNEPEHPLVSVILTHHNRPALLSQALDSLKDQDYPNIEVVVFDDASADFVEDIDVQGFLDQLDSDFQALGWQLIRHKGTGVYVGAGRNTAAKKAKGSYLLFMDDDNTAKPFEVSTFVKVAQHSRSGILTCFVDYFQGVDPPPHPGGYLSPPSYMFLGSALELALGKNVMGDANMFVRRDVFESVGGFSTERGLAFEDWQFMVVASLQGYSLNVIPYSLFWKRSSFGEKTMIEYALEGSGVYRSYRRVLDPYMAYVTPLHLKLASSLVCIGISHLILP
eukprot:TRINITY_DN5767_c0_g1_i2.p1 TRINITY_DN5767_c0_g1~~TRINITY_DN5767_c0_g1_i2.p1  ORF type:complete len:792 (-),score=184.39 TRINITY_DN5767_c0_g1_i2:1225-3600(-)